jgi:hypothetical protein
VRQSRLRRSDALLYLKKIAGPVVTVVYNVLNALSTACWLGDDYRVGSAYGFRSGFPKTNWYPSDVDLYANAGVGAVVCCWRSAVSRPWPGLPRLCAWMVLMFLAGALVTLPQLGSIENRRRCGEWPRTDLGEHGGGGSRWDRDLACRGVCLDLQPAMHLGLSDMACSATRGGRPMGFIGVWDVPGAHLSWICADHGAAAAKLLGRPLTGIDSAALPMRPWGRWGPGGGDCRWTTRIQRSTAPAGLQVVTPGWPRGW